MKKKYYVRCTHGVDTELKYPGTLNEIIRADELNHFSVINYAQHLTWFDPEEDLLRWLEGEAEPYLKRLEKEGVIIYLGKFRELTDVCQGISTDTNGLWNECVFQIQYSLEKDRDIPDFEIKKEHVLLDLEDLIDAAMSLRKFIERNERGLKEWFVFEPRSIFEAVRKWTRSLAGLAGVIQGAREEDTLEDALEEVIIIAQKMSEINARWKCPVAYYPEQKTLIFIAWSSHDDDLITHPWLVYPVESSEEAFWLIGKGHLQRIMDVVQAGEVEMAVRISVPPEFAI